MGNGIVQLIKAKGLSFILLIFFMAMTYLLITQENIVQDFSKSFMEAPHPQITTKAGNVEVKEAEISPSKTRAILWDAMEQLLKKQADKKSKRIPDVVGIGVEKCGTHALFQYLTPHPLLAMREPMEAHYFDGHYQWTMDQYRETMPAAESIVLIAEKTPAYFNFPPFETPQRLKSRLPNAKLLVVLCDPAKRVISDFAQEKAMKNKKILAIPTIEDYLRPQLLQQMQRFDKDPSMEVSHEVFHDMQRIDYTNHILTTGFYEHHMLRWYQFFNSSNLMVIDGDEMLVDPGAVIERVQDFLDIPKLLLREDFVRDPDTGFFCYKDHRNNQLDCLPKSKVRTRNGKVQTLPSTVRRLNDFYRPHIERLEKMLGREFAWGKRT